MSTADPTPSAEMGAIQQLLSLLVFDTLIALAITAFGENGLLINLVYSHCIGLCIWLLLQAQMLLFIRQRQTQWRRLWLAVPLGAVGGYLLGSRLAQALLEPFGIYTQVYHAQKTQGYLVLSLVAGAALTYYYMSRERLAHQRQATEVALRQAAQARLRLLESQLDPHMLFNTLSNLRALIASDPQRAQFMLDRMTDYLRATLSASLASSQSLQTEFARLRDYLELIAIRMGPRLQFALDLPDALADVAVPALLLQPLVENSVQHGLEPAVAGGRISVRAQQQGTQLLLLVEDSGAGLGTGSGTGTGFGLQQVRERLQATYGQAASLHISPLPGGGTRACVTLPLPA